MFGKNRFSRWLIGLVIIATAECAVFAAVEVSLITSAHAQFRDERYPFLSRQRPQRGGGFFGGFFGGYQRPFERGIEPQQAPADYSRAPAPRKHDPKAEPVVPTTSIVVMGDGMADWLAYGLEDAFSDSPEIAIVRKNKVHSGLLRYETKGDLDWWHVARDILNQEKANYVVMMLGVSDRQNIRERDLAKEADNKKTKDQQDKNADKNAQNKGQDDGQDQSSSIVAPEPERTKKASGVVEFRTDQWAEIYAKRIDETIAALKSKGVPVFWVGLPSIRGTRSTADVVYLNDLYRARVERAGAIYVDVWDGFVDEAGKYSNFGPDYEGQMRRLRSGDGVYFTKAGALKLAHYVEREIRRYMNSRATPVALPTGPLGPVTPDSKPAARPVAGPVVPLTVTPGNSDVLLGGAGNSAPHGDAIATQVLVKGEPVTAPRGRADDFNWQRSTDTGEPSPVSAAPAGALASAPANAAPAEPAAPSEAKAAPPKSSPAAKPANTANKPKPLRPPQYDNAPRPPQPISRSGGGPFGLFR